MHETKASKDFRFDEWCVSDKYPELAEKIKLTIADKLKIFYLVNTILQPIRDRFSNVVEIISGKRSMLLNSKIGGAVNSDHLFKNESIATDFIVHNVNMFKVFAYIKEELPNAFGQAILYIHDDGKPNFIHISLPTEKHRHQVLYKYKGEYHTEIPLPINDMLARIKPAEITF